ncbi:MULTISPECIES: transporter substrate-binding domain-containing protein [Fusobacterium]|uniref:transporter substrate-binding domain-containing protein n=1 Tax=Fusobacterium TaxID=848 RepID=UPI001476F124|nr:MULTISPECIES: transporter substrate-binding domain-containing protein [Fusobacterium]NME36672.1 transporter substrate-binding domain-containing protein [Fusobacterium sp. FSA-380-WT-3A]
MEKDYLQKDLMKEIRKRGILRVGTTGDYKPFTYIENQKYIGYDIEISRLLAKALSVDIEFVTTTWKDISKDLENQKYDIAVGGISKNLERENKFEMTDSYITSGKCYLVRKGDENKYKSINDVNNPNTIIGVNIGGTNEEFVDKNFNRAKIIKYFDNLEVPKAVANSDVDVMITDNSEVNYYRNHNPKLEGSQTDTPFTKCEKAYMLPKGQKNFLLFVNNLLKDLDKQGEMEKLKDKYLK